MSDIETRLRDTADEIERALLGMIPDPEPQGERLAEARLLEAMRYGCTGGKRMRGFLVLESARAFGVDGGAALNVACAVEALHAYSLVHDDLPDMDDDDLRRGRPTVHRAFDPCTAILEIGRASCRER